MEPEIHHGDIVIVRQETQFSDGDCVVALIDTDGVCKILKYRDDGISLVSTNPEYKPMNFTKEEIRDIPVRIIGLCEEVRHRIVR